jgi:hypothetical protein
MRFTNGSSVVVPQVSPGPATPGDYESTDQALVFATAAQLTKQAGTYPASMLGNAGFFKLDVVLTEHNNLSLRLNTSRYYGHNNVFLDPASPLTSFGISDNREEDVSTESGAVTLTSNLSVGQQAAGAVLTRLAAVNCQQRRSADQDSNPHRRLRTLIDTSAPNP